MNKPTLDSTQIEHPTQCKRESIVGDVLNETLGGTTNAQTAYRKYGYVLEFDPISYDNYQIIENLVNGAIDNNETLTFIYDKWTTSVSPGVECLARLSDWEKVGGSGEDYYGKCTLTLREAVKR